MAMLIFIIFHLLLEVKPQGSWSRDQESSHVNISSYYTVYASGENETSPHSDSVSVRVTDMSSSPPITEGIPATMTTNETLQANSSTVSTLNTTISLAATSSTEITTDSITYMSSLSTHDSHSLTDSANASLESTTLIDTTEHASVSLLTTEGPKIKKYSNTKVFFFIAVIASGGGIVLTLLVSICLYRCTRMSKADRIWMEFNSKKQEVNLPKASSDTTEEEDAVVYSTINFTQPPGNSEETRQTEVELNHVSYTISSDSRSIYSQLKFR